MRPAMVEGSTVVWMGRQGSAVSIDSVVDTGTSRQVSTPSVKGEAMEANVVVETTKYAERAMSMGSAWTPGLGAMPTGREAACAG